MIGSPHINWVLYWHNMEHYRNHKVYIKDTRSMTTGATVSFKHKYLTMPTVTTSDGLIKAAEYMSQAVQGVFPMSGPTQEAIEQLMIIFKEKARTEVDSAQFKGFSERKHYLKGCTRKRSMKQRILK